MTTVPTTSPNFSAESYRAHQMAIPGLDGYRAEKLAIALSGSVDLDTTSAEDLEFVNGLKLGQQVSLVVTATVTKKGFTLTPGNEERDDATGYGVGLKVHSFEVPAGS